MEGRWECNALFVPLAGVDLGGADGVGAAAIGVDTVAGATSETVGSRPDQTTNKFRVRCKCVARVQCRYYSLAGAAFAGVDGAGAGASVGTNTQRLRQLYTYMAARQTKTYLWFLPWLLLLTPF